MSISLGASVKRPLTHKAYFLENEYIQQHFTTFTPFWKLTSPVYIKHELSPLNFLRVRP